MVTDVVTGRQTIRMRVGDGRSEREKQVGRNLCGEVDGGERETRRAEPTPREQAENALEPGKKGGSSPGIINRPGAAGAVL